MASGDTETPAPVGPSPTRCLSAPDTGKTSCAASRLRRTLQTGRSLTMLWTILIILAIAALAYFIFTRVRGRGRV